MALELVRNERDTRGTIERVFSDTKLVQELLEEKERDLGKENRVRSAVEKNASFLGIPVVSVGNAYAKVDVNEIAHEKAMRSLNEKKRLRNFGAAINLDGSMAANIDRNMARAERAGFSKNEASRVVRGVTVSYSKVYRNSTDAEKDMGIARESLYRTDTPDRRMVETPDAIDWSKYAKWNRDERKRGPEDL